MWWILGGLGALWLLSRMGGSGSAAPLKSGADMPGRDLDTGDPACKGVKLLPPPVVGMGTGLEALPTVGLPDLDGKPYRAMIDDFLSTTKADFGGALGDAYLDMSIATLGTLATQLSCSNYSAAANKVLHKIEELRSWKSA